MLKLSIAAACLSSAFILPAQATDCSLATDLATEMQCAQQDLANANAQLSDLSDAITKRLEKAKRDPKPFKAANAAWQTFRDQECKFEGDEAPKGSDKLYRTRCGAALGWDRISHLHDATDCLDTSNPATCPFP